MAINCCGSTGVAVALIVSLLLLPGPELLSPAPPARPAPPPPAPSLTLLHHCPTADLVVAFGLLFYATITYLSEWGQRKFLERRMTKLNNYLTASVEKLVAWDVQQEQLESTLHMVQEATSEYNLLLYLLLRQHRCFSAGPEPRENYDAEFDRFDTDLYCRDPRIEA